MDSRSSVRRHTTQSIGAANTVGETSKAKHERIPVPKINTPKGMTNYLYNSRVIVQVVMRQTVTAAAQFQSQANARSTCCRKTGSETSFSASTSVLP